MIESNQCAVIDCNRPRVCKGYCKPHYRRFLNGIDLTIPFRQQTKSLICEVESCTREASAKGKCPLHYNRYRRGMDLYAPIRGGVKICTIKGCGRKTIAKGYCSGHYLRLKSGKSMDTPLGIKKQVLQCVFENCKNPVEGLKLCRTHYSMKRREEGYAYLLSIVGDFCKRCGNTYPFCVYDFHHIDPSTKRFSISSAIASLARERLLEEALKCEVLCANCHRLRHKEQNLQTIVQL